LDWAACRRCGTALPTILEIERVAMPASLPRRTPAQVAAARHASSAPLPLPPSDTWLPRASVTPPTPSPDPARRADNWVPKVPTGRTVARSAGIAAAVLSAALGVRRLLRHRT
jgi:hypothetical protein